MIEWPERVADPSKFPPPPKWGTWIAYRSGTSDFRTHTRLSFAKRSLTDSREGKLYEWNGTRWVFRAEYPDHESVTALF